MIVKGVAITNEQIDAMKKVMQQRFRASDIEAAAVAAGVEKGQISMRAVDRIIQRQRKAGQIRIVASGPYWEPVSH